MHRLTIVDRERRMGMLQTTLTVADDARRSICHTRQFCGWYIVYKRLGPPGTIHVACDLQEPHCHRIGIFVSNSYGIGEDHPQELLQKHQDVLTPEYPHRPCAVVSGDLQCVPETVSRPVLIWQWSAERLCWVMGSLGWRASNLE